MWVLGKIKPPPVLHLLLVDMAVKSRVANLVHWVDIVLPGVEDLQTWPMVVIKNKTQKNSATVA